MTLQGYLRASEVAKELGLPADPELMSMIGSLKCLSGDPAGLEQCAAAVRAGAELGLGPVQSHLLGDEAAAASWVRGPGAALEKILAAIDFAQRRGLQWDARFMRVQVLEDFLMVGRWGDALAEFPLLVSELVDAGDVADAQQLRLLQVLLLSLMGAKPELEEVVQHLQRPKALLPWAVPYFAVPMARASLCLGNESSSDYLREWVATPMRAISTEFSWLVPEGVRVALEGGIRDSPPRWRNDAVQRCRSSRRSRTRRRR